MIANSRVILSDSRVTKQADRGSYIGLPPWVEAAEVVWVPGLLNEQVHLTCNTQGRSFLQTLQLLFQPQEHTSRQPVFCTKITPTVTTAPLYGHTPLLPRSNA